ncbi:polysaccharide deacetylase family protein [Ekhidna lutea]|nr:polysaccharide deacetylase family protein [Ekhidna lutea]
MRKLIVLLTFLSFSCFAQERAICISIDDLPAVTYGISEHSQVITDGILNALQNHNVKAIGFVNEGKLYEGEALDSSKVELLDQWLKAGMDLGNHTYSHKNYHRVPFKEYTDDILKGERIIKSLATKYDTEIRYFRHPYLRSGLTAGSTDSLKTFLKESGYQESLVTIDNDDYLFAQKYAWAYRSGDTKLMKQIGDTYLTYMEEKLLYFEEISIELFGRNIKQTLLIHANFLNAQYLDALLKTYKEHGYTFISQDEAASDPAYQSSVTKFGDWGISWIHKWGMSQGKEGDFFKKDPPTPDLVR